MKNLKKITSLINIPKFILGGFLISAPNLINIAKAQPNGIAINTQQLLNNNFNTPVFNINNNTIPAQHKTTNSASPQHKKKHINSNQTLNVNTGNAQVTSQDANPSPQITAIVNNIELNNEGMVQTNNSRKLFEAEENFNNNVSNDNNESKMNDNSSKQNKVASTPDSERETANFRGFSNSKKNKHHNGISSKKMKLKRFSYCMNKKISRLFAKNKKMKFDPAACFAWNHN